jgi:DNA-binding LytR/AlgR family response regulator
LRNPSALLVEDEALLRAELRSHLRRLWPELHIVGEADNGIDALRLLGEHSPDVLFLDIELPRMSGLEVARQACGKCHVVFVTAYDTHAAAAFEQGAVDYVLKPFDPARLSLAVRRVEQRLGMTPPNLDGILRELAARTPPQSYLRWVNASKGATVQLVTVDDVCYFQSDTGYTRVVTTDGSELLIRRSLKELQGQLDPAIFWPVHRSTIVNARAIDSIIRDFRGRMSIKLKSRPERLPVSDAHAHLFRQM